MARTQIVVRARDRIAEELFARRQTERHEFEQLAMNVGRKIGFRDQRAPCRIAGIARHDFRQTLLANGGADAVGTHQQVGFDDFAIGKMRPHNIRILGKFGETTPAVIALRRKGIAQQAINPFPRGQHLRTFDLLCQATLRIENLAGCDVDPERVSGEPNSAQPLDQFSLRHDPGAAARQFAVHPFVNIYRPPGPPQQKAAEQAAHRATHNNCALRTSPGQLLSPDLSVYPFILYMTANRFGGIHMALTMREKQAEKKGMSQWPADIAAEFERESQNPNPCVGSTLLSENERTRVWIIRLAPGERIGFHRHVLDYFWTSVSGGRARQHVHDGTTVEYTYQPGETRHEGYGKDEFKVHDLENLGDREMVFMTVEFKDSANKPMTLPAGVRPQSAAA